MNFLKKKFCRIGLVALVAASAIAPLHPAIAKPKPNKPKPNQSPVEAVTTTTTTIPETFPETQIWDDLLTEIQNQNADLPTNLLETLRLDSAFRSQLLGLFWGQTGDRQTIQEILLDILQGQDENEHRDEHGDEHGDGSHVDASDIIHYTYTVDRACLPAGQRQRLDSGKPVPPGILKKCGHIRTLDD